MLPATKMRAAIRRDDCRPILPSKFPPQSPQEDDDDDDDDDNEEDEVEAAAVVMLHRPETRLVTKAASTVDETIRSCMVGVNWNCRWRGSIAPLRASRPNDNSDKKARW